MDIARVDPELRAATERGPKLNLENRAMLWLIGTASRLAPGSKLEGVERRIVHDGSTRVRVYVPRTPSGAGLLWIHGGGLVLGAAASDDRMCSAAARDTGTTIVSVEYGLAPRHPFPAPLDDCHAGWEWMLRHAPDLGLDVTRLAVGGQSAGGGLAASLVQRLHDEGADVAAQWLLCPMLDDRTAADRTRDAEDHFVWNNRSNLVGWRSYLGDRVGAPELPPYAAAARRVDLAGLPPAWLYVSDIELFHDEVVDYARRLKAAGVDVTLDILPGAPHGVEAWAPDTGSSREIVAKGTAWLAERLAR